MPVCQNCGEDFPNRVTINGIRKLVNTRKFCLACSPYGAHNTSQTPHLKYKCACGETNPSKFYGAKTRHCIECHNSYTITKGAEKRAFAIKVLGGKCGICGFSRYKSALQLHHLDPKIKDAKFRNMRNWSKTRIMAELKKCVLLCANCHAAHHNEGLSISAL
jgi:hypothetical protein